MAAVTFYALDDDGEDQVLGTVVWDGQQLTLSTQKVPFLQRVVDTLQQYPDPGAMMRELPKQYRSAYMRAEFKE